MGKVLKDEDLRLNVIINGNKAKKELGELEQSTRGLTQANKELKAQRMLLEKQGKKETEEYKKISAAIKENSAEMKKNETRMSVLRKQIGLTGLTMKQLRQEQSRLKMALQNMTPGTAAFKDYENQLRKVNTRLGQVASGARSTGTSIQKLSGNFNKYAAIGASVIATLTGIVFAIKGLFTSNAELSDSFADVAKTTGLTIQEVKLLNKELLKLNTRSSQKELLDLSRIAGKLGVTGVANIRGFVSAADKINVSLSEDLGGNTEETIRQVGKLVDIFKVKDKFGLESGLLKVGSAINSLGAASTANEGYMVEFAKRFGGIAPNADISIQDTLGLAATLDQLGQSTEVSTTAMGQLMVAMGKDIPKFAKIANMSIDSFSKLLGEDANEALIKVLEGAKSNKAGLEGMAESLDKLGIDGQRAVGVVGVLSNNIDMLRGQQKLSNAEFEKGTSITDEFNTKNTTLAANANKIGKRLKSAFVNSGFVDALSKGVSYIEKWTRADVTTEIEKERQKVNILTTQLTDSNNTLEDREKIYNRLKEIAPDVIRNIDLESISTEQLSSNLREYNEQAIKKIVIAKQDEKLQALREDQANKALIAAQKNLAIIGRVNSLLNKSGKNKEVSEIMLGAGTNAEKATKAMALFSREILLAGQRQTLINNAIIEYKEADKEAKEAKDKLNEATKHQLELERELFGLKTPTTPTTPTTTTTTTTPTTTTGGNTAALERTKTLLEEIEAIDAESDGAYIELMISKAQEYNQLINDDRADTKEFQRQLIDDLISGEEERMQKVIENDLKEREMYEAKKTLALGAATAIANGIYQISQNRRSKETNAEIRTLNEVRDKKLENENLTNEETDKIKAEYAEKERQIKIRAWEAEQQAAVRMAIIQGVLAIAKTFATAGYPAGIPLAKLAGIETGIQVAAIKSQEVPQFAKGLYPAIGESDGKQYNANYVGNIKTGLYNKPSLGLFSEKEPEFVIDGPTTKNIMLNAPDIIRSIEAMRIPQYASGKYPETVTREVSEKMFTDPEMLSAIRRLNTNLERGIKAKVIYRDIEDIEENIDRLKSEFE